MRILYCALDQRIPGTVGGSVHTLSVAEGLAALGHDLHVVAAPGDGPFPDDGVQWRALGPPLGRPHLRVLRAARLVTIARQFKPDVVMERYHNFGGEGLRAARAVGARTVLEVNAPMIDHAGSIKARVDRALLVAPLRRWREWQCARTDLFVTPSRAILPAFVPRSRVLEIEWGADTDRFAPATGATPPYVRPRGTLVAFAGAFRAWHGAQHLVRAISQLRSKGVADVSAVLIGTGPEWHAARAAAGTTEGILFTGPLPHDRMPAALSAADVGAAPFDTGRHASLAIDFYWSPLKVFEYMAAGLPVLAPQIDRLSRLVGHGREGLLYDAADPSALADAILALHLDPERRRALGHAARMRAVTAFSWRAHCDRLSDALETLVRSGP
jgi:glycosyltransferase involved in cell wall biosynthesis